MGEDRSALALLQHPELGIQGVAQAIESGNAPVTLNLPLFRLVARQSEPPSRRVLMRVIDSNGRESSATMEPGQTAQVGGLSITLLGSIAVEGPRAGRLEGSPYSISVLVWRSGS